MVFLLDSLQVSSGMERVILKEKEGWKILMHQPKRSRSWAEILNTT